MNHHCADLRNGVVDRCTGRLFSRMHAGREFAIEPQGLLFAFSLY